MKGKKRYIETVGGGISYLTPIGKSHGYTVLRTPKRIKNGYIGINQPVAKALEVKTDIKHNEIVVYCNGLKKSTVKNTERHEPIEEHVFRYGKLTGTPHRKYQKAHKVALKFEATKVTPKQALKWYKGHK